MPQMLTQDLTLLFGALVVQSDAFTLIVAGVLSMTFMGFAGMGR